MAEPGLLIAAEFFDEEMSPRGRAAYLRLLAKASRVYRYEYRITPGRFLIDAGPTANRGDFNELVTLELLVPTPDYGKPWMRVVVHPCIQIRFLYRPTLSPSDRKQILARDGANCALCGSTDRLAVDHVLPLTRGGTNDPKNLRVLCKSCNSKKGNSLPTIEGDL